MICSYLTFVAMVTVVFGCSPPEGGFVPPTPAQKVHFAEYLVIGKVTKILQVDPIYGEMYDSTYGADFYVQCSYKGDVLPGNIKIGGAGFIPGRCTAKELELGKKYLVFLNKNTGLNNETAYEQTDIPEKYFKISNYLDVCGLKMEYPHEGNFGLKRQVCDYEKEGPCKTFNIETQQVETKGGVEHEHKKKTPRINADMDTSMNVVDVIESTTPKDDSGASGLTVSFGMLLISFLGIIV